MLFKEIIGLVSNLYKPSGQNAKITIVKAGSAYSSHKGLNG
jgi:hypothetical protein